ncbi:MAG: hypothetical protein ACLR02_09930 [Clostridium sp.]
MKIRKLKTNEIFEVIHSEEADCYLLIQENKIVNSISSCTFYILLCDFNFKEYEIIEE